MRGLIAIVKPPALPEDTYFVKFRSRTFPVLHSFEMWHDFIGGVL
jgi:hypothetical protein